MAETLQTLSIISFAVAGVCLALTIFFGFFFKIPTVIGDLSGRTAKKSIAKMRATNERTGIKQFKGSKTNAERGKLTGTMPDLDKLDKKQEISVSDRPETDLLAENQADQLTTEATGLLENDATGKLEDEATGLLANENATASLDTSIQSKIEHKSGKQLTMLEEIILIHTDEVIE